MAQQLQSVVIMHPITTNAKGLRMLKASGVVCGLSSFGVSSDCLQISGYNPIIRLERHQRRGGGVALFETDSFVSPRELPENKNRL